MIDDMQLGSVMKLCVDLQHEGEGKLHLAFFYRNPRTFDGRLNICITCAKRRATAREYRFRDERKAQGLPCRVSESERLAKQQDKKSDYHERSQLRREEEASHQQAAAAVQPIEVELRGLYLHEQFEAKNLTQPKWRIA